MSFQGHLWTLWPLLQRRLRPQPPPPGEPWETRIEDPDLGSVRLCGRLAAPPESSRLLIVVHGIGGSIDSPSMVAGARAAEAAGLASLRLNLRGADRGGQDFYHAGLSCDLAQTVASPALERFERIYLLGHSLGGHLCLRFATEVEDPRVRAVAAVCSPLDLERTVEDFDRPRSWAYRRFVLARLSSLIDALDERLPIDREAARRARKLRDFDRSTVVRRFGFASARDYYRRAGVAERLDRLRVPTLLVAAEDDPMVTARSVRAGLRKAPERLRVEWVRRGGHVYFPADLDLGQPAPRGLAPQVLAWLEAADGG